MSSRRRKRAGELFASEPVPLEHFPTPPWVTRVLLRELGEPLRDRTVLECTAGDGAIVDVLHEAGAIVDAVELDPGRAEIVRAAGRARQVVCGSFLESATTDVLDRVSWAETRAGLPYDFVISNPPYSEVLDTGALHDLALDVVRRAMLFAPTVIMLLRLGWAGAQQRFTFHRANPADPIVLSNRPRFAGRGNDSAEYAWWIWRRGATIGTWRVAFSEEALTWKLREKDTAQLPLLR